MGFSLAAATNKDFFEFGASPDSEKWIFGCDKGRKRVCGEVYTATPKP
jgi:hypothetical protein